MLKRSVILLLLFWTANTGLQSQDMSAGPGFQSLLINNPSLSGSEGNGVLRMSYLNLFPGNNYNLNSLYLSYDSYIPEVHGGAGFYIAEDYMGGIINDLRGGFSYAYFLQAGKDLFINAGLTASVFHRGFSFGNAVLPDQIDPLGGVSLPASEILDSRGKTVFDVGVGFLLMSGRTEGGIAVNHLAEPEIYAGEISTEKIRRKYYMHFSTGLDLNSTGNTVIEPLLLASVQGEYFTGGAGVAIEGGHLALNTVFSGDNGKNINMQSGFTFRLGFACVYYNYQFNLKSGNALLPLSMFHQVGLALRLNNVEKRKPPKAINFPKL